MDKQKVRDYLEQVETDYLLSASDFDQGILYQARRMKEALDRGEFDPTPSPTIKPGDKVRIISALAREWIGREAVVTEVYTEPFLHFSLDIGGGHWTPSCLEVIESD